MLRIFGCVLAGLFCISAALAAGEPEVVFRVDGANAAFSAARLLARPDAARITVPADVAYGRAPMSYRAVPLAAVMKDAGLSPDAPVEVTSTDGFIAQIPAGLFADKGPGAPRAYLAIETAEEPWPKLKGKDVSAGPFYIVWIGPGVSAIGTEQWPYQVAALESADDPRVRWPPLDVPAGLAADDPARAGLAVFIRNCLPCHRMNGGGESTVGPDLNLPMNPTEYFQPAALRKYIRDPESVRSWPERRMQGFSAEALPEAELDGLIAYLSAMRARRP